MKNKKWMFLFKGVGVNSEYKGIDGRGDVLFGNMFVETKYVNHHSTFRDFGSFVGIIDGDTVENIYAKNEKALYTYNNYKQVILSTSRWASSNYFKTEFTKILGV